MMEETGTVETPEKPVEWAIVELMGHTRMAGILSEEQRFGATLGRLDVSTDDEGNFATTYFSGASIYRVTLVSKETALTVARPSRYVYRSPVAALPSGPFCDDDDSDDDDYEEGNSYPDGIDGMPGGERTV